MHFQNVSLRPTMCSCFFTTPRCGMHTGSILTSLIPKVWKAIPALVIAGPMLGDWLNQCVEEWLGDNGRLVSIEYSNRAATYIGETLTSGGTVIEVDPAAGAVRVEVFIKNAAGEVVTPGVATAVLDAQ